MPRFAILRHECPPEYVRPSHWDLMLESGRGLRTWALLELPSDLRLGNDRECARRATNVVQCEELGLHRLDYLTLEGPLSGNRGSVRRVAEGDYRMLAESPDSWELQLTGSAISGRLGLSRHQENPHYWRLEWSPD